MSVILGLTPYKWPPQDPTHAANIKANELVVQSLYIVRTLAVAYIGFSISRVLLSRPVLQLRITSLPMEVM